MEFFALLRGVPEKEVGKVSQAPESQPALGIGGLLTMTQALGCFSACVQQCEPLMLALVFRVGILRGDGSGVGGQAQAGGQRERTAATHGSFFLALGLSAVAMLWSENLFLS